MIDLTPLNVILAAGGITLWMFGLAAFMIAAAELVAKLAGHDR